MARRRKQTIASPALTADPGEMAVGALARGLEILRLFAPHLDTLSVAQIAVQLGLPRMTTSRLVETLVVHQFLHRIPGTDLYQPGVSCLVVGHALLASHPTLHVVRPILQSLATQLRVNVAMAAQERMEMLVVDYFASAEISSARTRIGTLAPVASTALGHAWLWAQPGSVQGQLVEQFKAYGDERTKRSIPGLYRAFKELEELGYCLLSGDGGRDAQSVASPLTISGTTQFAISCEITGNESQELRLRTEIGPALLKAISQINDAIARTPVN
jgi:DNA-binding IclR family transcriptional regulator